MPRVFTQTKSKQGREIHCRTCHTKIEPGERYYKYSFRYGGTYTHCGGHPPQPWDLTQSKMGTIYLEQQTARDAVDCAESIEDIRDAVQALANTVSEVRDEYRDAAEEHFQGGGPNAEIADELEGWVDELESWEPSNDEPEVEAWNEDQKAIDLSQELFDVDQPELLGDEDLDTLNEALEKAKAEHDQEAKEALESLLEEIRVEATDIIDECPR